MAKKKKSAKKIERKVDDTLKKAKIVKKKEKPEDKYFISYVPEIKLLEKGKVPGETKMGTEFKGKNKVIISGK